MSIAFFDLAGADGRGFSPNCWRTRMALAHKGLAYDRRATLFTEIAGICGGGQKAIPVIEDGTAVVSDSWAIAEYLEDTYPDRPSLFGGPGGRALSRFVGRFCDAVLHAGLIRLVVKDIHDHLAPADQAYFRENREARFNAKLEDIVVDRDARLPAFRQSLTPLRLTLASQPFLGGDGPLYADHLAFGALQWARTISPLRMLESDDPVHDWFQRCLDLHDGLGRAEPGYD